MAHAVILGLGVKLDFIGEWGRCAHQPVSRRAVVGQGHVGRAGRCPNRGCARPRVLDRDRIWAYRLRVQSAAKQ